jgi:large subunit ribosomal protein L17
MRHKRRGRKLGRNPSHQRALLRSLASALILTERDPELYDTSDPTLPKPPKVPGRIITTLQKAKEVRPLLERCITIARRALPHQDTADELAPNADRDSAEWDSWRHSDQWNQWNQAIAPAVAARRRALKLLGNKEAVQILFDEIAPRLSQRDGGYTRVLRLAQPRLGDAGAQAILELVGTHDRKRRRATKPSFEDKPAAKKEPIGQQDVEKEVEESDTDELGSPVDEDTTTDETETEAAHEDPAAPSEEAREEDGKD